MNGTDAETIIAERLRANLAAVRARIAAAAARSGRDPASVRLVAVTKSVTPAVIRLLAAGGMHDLGENRVQQLGERAALLPGDLSAGIRPSGARTSDAGPLITWHMIGHLQRNKVRPLLRCCRVVHSVDSARLAAELQREATALGADVDVLAEVNVAGESQKHGTDPSDLGPLLDRIGECDRLHLCGLMTVAPLVAAPEAARPCFARLAQLLREQQATGKVHWAASHLSMGMSQDFEVAVEEGATIVRIGSALFEDCCDESGRGV